MRKHKDFMSEPDYGYIDIESCFEPIFEPPLETLEEWHSWEDEPEPTLENTSVYVTEPETSCQGLFNQIHKKATKKVPEALSCS